MSVLIYNVVTAALLVLAFKAGERLLVPAGDIDWRASIRRRFPVVAAVLTALIVGGLVLQAVWPGAMNALDSDPSRHGWWRPVTSVLMQNGGLFGNLWNVVTIAIIAAVAEWYWGRIAAALLFLAGALVPYWIELVFGSGHGSTDPRNWCGSSGATYFLAGTLAGALLVRALRPRGVKNLLLGLAVPVAGLVAWFAQNNAHGLVTAYGAAMGLVVALVFGAFGASGALGASGASGASGAAAKGSLPHQAQDRCVSKS